MQEEYESLKNAIDYAAEKGVIVIAAVGNDGDSTVYYPAEYDSVIGVGAVNRDGDLYDWSNTNSTVFLTAPGGNLRSTAASGGYTTKTGTSYAVPQVAGAAAVLLSAEPTLTPAQIMDIMANTATDKGPEGYDEYYGFGILNMAGCIEKLLSKPDNPLEPTEEDKRGYADCPGDATCVMAEFSDLDCDSWYHDGVHFVLGNGIMNGVGGQTFAPDVPASRAMVVTILWRMEEMPITRDNIPFADVPAGAWFAEAVRWAAAEQIVDGYSPDRFGPNDNVSREQLAAILWRYANYKDDERLSASSFDLSVFQDAEIISPWAYAGMQWAVNAGLLTGVGEERLSPDTSASRAQLATLLMRYCA